MPTPVAAAAAVARAARAGDPVAEEAARANLAATKIETYMARVLASAPPLSDEQRVRLAELLRPVRVAPKASTPKAARKAARRA